MRLLASFDDSDDWRAVNAFALTAKITSLLSLKFANVVRYSHFPPAGLQNNGCDDVDCAGGVVQAAVTDDLVARVAEAAERPLRLHGSIWLLRCWKGCVVGQEDWLEETCPFPTLPPRCPHCGGLARPAVVWFGESLDPQVLERAADAAACDVFLTVGTSAVVYPAAGLVHHAKRRGALTVEINPDATDASSRVDIAIRERAELALPAIESQLTRGA